ncbi:protein phosphatase 2C domain-containing protein [Reyranella sp. CPCC 100927]|nr:protein phosphatase 2C domain-containing protein [Reyranella sp. CPCC 100927]
MMVDSVMTSRMAWTLGGASVRGASHVRRGQPNQDAIGWVPPAATQATEGFVAAISDGHGGAAYYRSEVGSRLAVEVAKATLGRYLEAPDPSDDAAAIVAEVLVSWRQAVAEDLARHPVDSEWVESEQEKLLPYGATLAAVAVRPDRLIVLQIGDGDILFGYPDGRVDRPLPNDEGLVGEQTYSLCLDNAAQRFRAHVRRRLDGQPWPDFVMLSTDGVSKSFADEKTFLSIGRDYRTSVRKMGLRSVLDKLDKWLGDVSQRGSGDDVTLCLAIGSPAQAPADTAPAVEYAPETSV